MILEFAATTSIAALLGLCVAWVIRGARADAEAAAATTRVQALQREIALAAEAHRSLQVTHADVVREHLQESISRSAAEAAASRIPELEGRIAILTGQLSGAAERRAAFELQAGRIPHLERELSAAREQLNSAQATITQLSVERADLGTQLSAERQQGEEKLQLLNEAKQALADSFKALSNDALRHNNQSFLDLAKATLERFQEGARGDLEARQRAVDQLVQPLQDCLSKFDSRLGEMESQRVSSYSALNEQLRGLVEVHLPSIHTQTSNLVKALRQPAVRGRWGELQLRRVVEMAGMLDHCDFVEQESRDTEEGKVRPDLIVKLPGGRHIVVDAKAPTDAYIQAVEAQDDAMQRALMTQHAQQVRSHVISLGRKGYWEQFSPTPEFVVMFIPGESFFSGALQEDPSLIEYGVGERVIVAAPTTLIALLRAVAYGWRQERLAENAEEVAKLGKELYERICTLGGHWSDVGDRLRKTVEAFNGATRSLDTRVIVAARRFRDLKVGAEDAEIVQVEEIEVIPRFSQAEELIPEQLAGASPSRARPLINAAG